jgi:ParB family chromosome partitioning protein
MGQKGAGGVTEIKSLAINKISPSKTNPRTSFDERKLNELAKSIKKSGVVQPLLVRHLSGESYELIAGERRLRASQRAGLTEVPCVVQELTEGELLEIQIVENAQREDVNPMDEARALNRLREQLSYDVGEIAERIGKSESYVYNQLKLCSLPEEAQELIYGGGISKAVAWQIIRLKEPSHQLRAAKDLAKAEWSENLTTAKAAQSYIRRNFGDDAQVRARKPSDVGGRKKANYKANPQSYTGNWKHYLVRFDGRQFARWRQVVNGRTETQILAEAVEAVMLDEREKQAAA